MRNLLLFVFLSISFAGLSKPKVYFQYKIYYTAENKPYISTSLQFHAGTLKYIADENGNLSASIEITQIFTHDDSSIVADKYILNSPLMSDSTVEDFYDMQRYQLIPGGYSYELSIKDLNTGEIVTGKQLLEVETLNTSEIKFSDLTFLEDVKASDEKNNFVKNGFFMLPYLTNYFPPEITKLAFYSEVYNSLTTMQKGDPFLITASIHKFNSRQALPDFFKFQRLKAAEVNPAIIFLPIDQLPSGDYDLWLHVVNKDNDTIASQSTFFQRRNENDIKENVDIANLQIDQSFKKAIKADSIKYYLGSLMAISERYEYEHIRKTLKGDDTTYMLKYFYNYWLKTSPDQPYLAWLKYKKQVIYAEKLFGTHIKAGYETDRGRIHLKYGPPNAMIDRPNEPSAYPYQIWHYYRIGARSNVKFVFYNPDLVSKDYPLLHSDMQGELQNYRWQVDLHKRNSSAINVDDTESQDHFGGQSGIFYNGGM